MTAEKFEHFGSGSGGGGGGGVGGCDIGVVAFWFAIAVLPWRCLVLLETLRGVLQECAEGRRADLRLSLEVLKLVPTT